MIPLGLSAADQVAYNLSLAESHSIDVRICVLNMNHVPISDLSATLLDGQVNVDVSADVTRNCTLSFLDPDRTMQFDADNPNDGAVFMDRMIEVQYGVYSERVPRWIYAPIFTGPITRLSRSDDIVNVEAQGKETRAQRAAWRTVTYKAGLYTVDVIKSLLANTGETKFTLPGKAGKLSKALSINRETVVWDVVKQYKGAYRAFYDARGIFVLRSHNSRSLWNFKQGAGGTLKSYPEVSYSTDDVKNVVLVKGGVPKGSKKAVEGTAYAPASHPFSANTLGRNGFPHYMPAVFEDTNLKTAAACVASAKSRLNSLLLQGIEAQFDAMVVPHLEPYDVVTVSTPEFALNFVVTKFSIPLVHSGSMSVGYLRKATPNKVKIRKKK